jgi:hypothetical protein
MRTLIKSYRLFLSFSVCHLIILWALAAGCANAALTAHWMRHISKCWNCCFVFVPLNPGEREIDDITRYELLFCYTTTAQVRNSTPCSYLYPLPVNRVTLSCYGRVRCGATTNWIAWNSRRVAEKACGELKEYQKAIAAWRFFFFRAWESRGPCCTADIECFLSFWRDDYSSPRVHLHWKQVKVEQRNAIFFLFFFKLLNVFGLCFAPLAYTRWLPVR